MIVKHGLLRANLNNAWLRAIAVKEELESFPPDAQLCPLIETQEKGEFFQLMVLIPIPPELDGWWRIPVRRRDGSGIPGDLPWSEESVFVREGQDIRFEILLRYSKADFEALQEEAHHKCRLLEMARINGEERAVDLEQIEETTRGLKIRQIRVVGAANG